MRTTKKAPAKKPARKKQTKDIAVVEPKKEVQQELTPETVRKYLVSGNAPVTDQEIMMFLQLCKHQKLNPFIREAYLIKYNSAQPATMVVGKGVFTKRAQKNVNFRGYRAGVILSKETTIYREGAMVLPGETLLGGWAEVYINGWAVPIRAEVSLQEYKGSPTSSWGKMPATMIRKVALVQALREAFPEDFQGLYDSSEMNVEIPDIGGKEERLLKPDPEPPEAEKRLVNATAKLSKAVDQKKDLSSMTIAQITEEIKSIIENPIFSDHEKFLNRNRSREIYKKKDRELLIKFFVEIELELHKKQKSVDFTDAENAGFGDIK